jgi:inhibitor of the pro-sigma K processing machinery
MMALAMLRRPLGSLVRLAGRTGLGLCFLTIFAPAGQFLGAGLGVNLFNALILGILGIPGFGLLMMLNWALR